MPNTAYCSGQSVVIECEIDTLKNQTMNSKRYMETYIGPNRTQTVTDSSPPYIQLMSDWFVELRKGCGAAHANK
jgi:hypothetical protein